MTDPDSGSEGTAAEPPASAQTLFDRAPCGLLTTTADGVILLANQTILDWLGLQRDELVGRKQFAQLLTAGGRIYHQTHYAPMLRLQGRVREIALDLVCTDGSRLPVLVSSTIEQQPDGAPVFVHIALFAATERREYERELLRAKQHAEESERRSDLLARTLQQTLIPPALPSIAGLDLAAAYRPAGDGREIGGDFYDVFQIGVGDWVVAIGDVQGKGVDAAVVTALVRHTIRGASVEHDRPSDVLHVLNRVLFHDQTERLCTALLVRLRDTPRGWRAEISCGGHPLPLLRGASGDAVEVGAAGSLLGHFETGTFHDVEVAMANGSMVVLYTDGVSEARRDGEWFGEERIIETLGRTWVSAGEFTEHLLQDVLHFEGSTPRDDIAIVSVRVP